MGIIIGEGLRCAALGCQEKPGETGSFCDSHWRVLPEGLRGPGALRQAVIHLGKKDGYLVDAKVVKNSGLREDGNPVDYV
jgi:hypothetical protein